MKAGSDVFLCDYIFRNGEKCREPVIGGTQFCVLHTPFPEDTESKEYQQLKELKAKKAQEKVNSGDFNFEGAIFYSFNLKVQTDGDINFDRVRIIKNAKFDYANISGNALFHGAEIDGDVLFNVAKIDGDILFNVAKIGGNVLFNVAKIGGNTWFNSVNIGEYAIFDKAKIGDSALFNNAKIDKEVWFRDVKIGGYAFFNDANFGGNVLFNDAKIDGNALFESASFSGELDIIPIYVKGIVNFRDATFSFPKAQEEACRVAKNSCINFGDNHEADNYFYREMEGKRKQKPKIFRWPEYILVQLIFGYGVKPLRTFCVWFVAIIAFALIYYNFQVLISGSEFIEYVYFSTTTAMTPGFGGYKISPTWQWLALIEAFFGTFMWAAFITIFARKYMR